MLIVLLGCGAMLGSWQLLHLALLILRLVVFCWYVLWSGGVVVQLLLFSRLLVWLCVKGAAVAVLVWCCCY